MAGRIARLRRGLALWNRVTGPDWSRIASGVVSAGERTLGPSRVTAGVLSTPPDSRRFQDLAGYERYMTPHMATGGHEKLRNMVIARKLIPRYFKGSAQHIRT